MKKMVLDDFIKYAKEEFNCDILLKACDKPDTFRSIFGHSFLKEEEYEQKIEGFDDDFCYNNDFINVRFVIDGGMVDIYDSNVGLAA